jgi:hypothetical protein
MLPCLLQVVLDNTQIAAVILSQDLMWHLPDWAVHALSGMLMTQASTWQWVPFDCLLPGCSAVSAAAVQAVLVMLLPSELCQRTADACRVAVNCISELKDGPFSRLELLPANWPATHWSLSTTE